MSINGILTRIRRLSVELMSHLYRYNVKRKAKTCGKGLKVWRYSILNHNTYLSDYVNMNGMRIYGYGKVEIGSHFHAGVDCTMISSNHNYEGDKIPYDDTNIEKPIVIEDCVWIGSKVMILGGVTIGEGAIVQAGSVVVSNIPKCAIAGGNPAKVFKYRDIEHYEKLKMEKKFLYD